MTGRMSLETKYLFSFPHIALSPPFIYSHLPQPSMSYPKKKFVAVGTGGRIVMFLDHIVKEGAGSCELLALCDLSQVRMNFHKARLAKEYGYLKEIRTYLAEDFDRMIDELQPDIVIVCTTDSMHHEYIVRSLDKGCDVVCEKPITIDIQKSQAILDAVQRTGRNVRVTFNVRWTPGATKVRELLQAGTIGQVKHVQMEYLLDTSHGADYFRRWHSQKASSGGLLVHKCTHHFDLVNWWVNSIPDTIYSLGGLVFYGRENAIARGQQQLTAYDRHSQTTKEEDPFHFDFKSVEILRGLYHDAEAETGYIRDKNVFRDGIDIEDSMSVLVKYRSGVMFTYSLNAFCSEEGCKVSITGDKGRIEYTDMHRYHLNAGDDTTSQNQIGSMRSLRVLPLFAPAYHIEVPNLAGGHGGGDALICEQIFSPHPANDPYSRSAGHEQGLASALVGIAANQSIATGLPVKIDDLVTLSPAATRLDQLS